MQSTLFLVLLFSAFSLLRAQDIASLEYLSSGKCVWSNNAPQDNISSKSGYILRLLPPRYIQHQDSIKLSELDFQGAEAIRFCITETTTMFVFSKKVEQNCVEHKKHTKGFHTICAIEVPAQYRTITQPTITALRSTENIYFVYAHEQLLQKGILQRVFKKRKPFFLKKKYLCR